VASTARAAVTNSQPAEPVKPRGIAVLRLADQKRIKLLVVSTWRSFVSRIVSSFHPTLLQIPGWPVQSVANAWNPSFYESIASGAA